MRPDLLGGATSRGAVFIDEALHGVAEVPEQMPSIGDLNRGWHALPNPVGIRATISTPGRLRSQAATVAASRSGRRSTTLFVSRSTITVP